MFGGNYESHGVSQTKRVGIASVDDIRESSIADAKRLAPDDSYTPTGEFEDQH